jgi:PhzF family phenazine biosynthesis protein
LMVRVLDARTVDTAQPDPDSLRKVLKISGAEGCYVYAFESGENDIAYARFFNPTVGLWEDAATGTAAGPLAAYLGTERLLRNNHLTVERGTKMGRKSILRLRLAPEPELSGSGIVVLRGRIHLGMPRQAPSS